MEVGVQETVNPLRSYFLDLVLISSSGFFHQKLKDVQMCSVFAFGSLNGSSGCFLCF